MSPSRPFFGPDASLDTDQLLAEAYPLAGLVLLFGGLALVPFLFALLFAGTFLSPVFTVLAQLVAAVGGSLALMYVVARGIQLAVE